jgi:phosphatidylinositol alpha-1,6-mannosyltransferase
MIDKKINSLLLTYDFPPLSGGIAIAMQKVSECLKENGVYVLTAENHEVGKQAESGLGIKIIRRNFNLNVPYWKLPLELIKLLSFTFRLYGISRFKIMLVGEVFPLGLLGLFFKLFFKVKFITFSHGSDSLFSGSSLRDFLVGLIFKKADAVICFSDYTRNNILKWPVKSERIKKISLGVDTEKFNPGVSAAGVINQFSLKDKQVILTVNRLIKRKGMDSVLGCLPEVIKECPSTVYLIVGQGPDELRLKDLVKELKLENHVIFTGEVKNEFLPGFFAACDIFVNPVRELRLPGRNETEGLGLVNLEAGASAKPVITCATGGVVETIDNRQTGLFIDPSDEQELRSAIISLLKDKVKSRKMGQLAREKVLKQFTIGQMKNQLLTIIEELN